MDRARTSRSTRTEELARLLPVWPAELQDVSLEGRRHIVARLAKALREERRRGQAGHWAYDLARHAQLHAVWLAERATLRQMECASAGLQKPKSPRENGPSS